MPSFLACDCVGGHKDRGKVRRVENSLLQPENRASSDAETVIVTCVQQGTRLPCPASYSALLASLTFLQGSDHIITLLRGGRRFGPLGPTSLRSDRCTFSVAGAWLRITHRIRLGLPLSSPPSSTGITSRRTYELSQRVFHIVFRTDRYFHSRRVRQLTVSRKM